MRPVTVLQRYRIPRRKLFSVAGAAVGATALMACRPRSDGTAALQLGYFPNVTHAPALLGTRFGIYGAELGNLKVNPRLFNAGPALVEAMLAGAVDIGFVGPSPAINAYVRTKGRALRIIAGCASGGVSLIVRNDSGIMAPADLTGRKIGTPQRGGTQDIALRIYLRDNGLIPADAGGTVAIVPTANPQILELFRRAQLDGAWVPEPWAGRMVEELNGRVLIDERTLWPGGRFSSAVIIVNTRFLTEHPDEVDSFIRGHLRSLEMIGRDRQEAIRAVAAEIERLTLHPITEQLVVRGMHAVDFTSDPLADTVAIQAARAYQLGFLGGTEPDVSQIVDTSVLRAATH